MDYVNRDLAKRIQKLTNWVDQGKDAGVERYTLGFLVRKLPKGGNPYDLAIGPDLPGEEDKWKAGYIWLGDESGWMEYELADTPEDAVAKLVLSQLEKGNIAKH